MSFMSYRELPKRKISTRHGIGIKWTDNEGTEWRTTADSEAAVRLSITSFVSIVAGAEHYYGVLQVRKPTCEVVKVGKGDKYHKKGDRFSLGGAYERWMPEATKGITLELQRPLKKWELRTRRFKDYRHLEDPHTTAFYSQLDVIREAKRVFADHFAKGWKLDLSDVCEDEE
jgi:hypothetical protein